MKDSDKIILDLCGGTGAWSRPYKEAGYDVRLITLPEQDVRYYKPPKNVYGILAAPPCTDFCISGTRWWAEKDRTKGLLEALSVVATCLRIIYKAKPKFWALENPVGRLPRYIGKYKYTFQPYEYGDPWTKRTCIWGEHNIPVKHPVEIKYPHADGEPSASQIIRERLPSWTGGSNGTVLGIADHLKELPADWIHRLPPSPNRAMLRSITPPGFARAFFEANR
ncbi:MAG: hypothetical protein PHQ86_01815 [Dehalococcoidales bacterium]|nr:hypothetical protein [Dehalococcoidales bacterium]